MGFGKEELDAVMRVMQSGKLSGYQGNYSEQFYGGEEVRALEKEWALYFGSKHAIFCNSATSGLWAACAVIGLIPGDECLVTPYSMSCSASIPLQFGAKPVFIDIEPDYFCMNPNEIESKITNKTKAIIAVNIFGQPCDFDKINNIAKKYNLIVIEDAAQSIGATYKGRYAGTLADIGVFSLNRHKHINCGEGGVIYTDDDELAFKLRLVLNHSESVVNDMQRQNIIDYQKYASVWPGMNLRGTELSAAIAREQLKKLNGILEIIRENAKCFPVKVREGCKSAFYRYAMLKEEWEKMPEEYHYLYDWKQHYITPLFKMPLFKSLGYDQDQCPVCQRVDENIILAWLKDMP